MRSALRVRRELNQSRASGSANAMYSEPDGGPMRPPPAAAHHELPPVHGVDRGCREAGGRQLRLPQQAAVPGVVGPDFPVRRRGDEDQAPRRSPPARRSSQSRDPARRSADSRRTAPASRTHRSPGRPTSACPRASGCPAGRPDPAAKCSRRTRSPPRSTAAGPLPLPGSGCSGSRRGSRSRPDARNRSSVPARCAPRR